MEPVTHALASLALGRAGFDRTTRRATPMLLVAGLAADLDWLSYLGGPHAFLAGHRTATHSLLGSAVIAIATAWLFFWASRRSAAGRIRFAPALAVCAAASGLHLLLDLTNSNGVQLFWPFTATWFAWDLADSIDGWLLIFLLAGLLLPKLFGLIREEIGERSKRTTPSRAILLPVFVLLYFGGRTFLHERALAVLNARLYSGEAPLRVGAFPDSFSPLAWRGVVETRDALAEIAVPLGPGGTFDPDAQRRYFKPEESPALTNARESPAAATFLAFARFPLATVEGTSQGYEVKIRDLRFAPSRSNIVAIIQLDRNSRVTTSTMLIEKDGGQGLP